MTETDIFRGLGVQIELINEQAFLMIMETLERIGIASKATSTLYQSCHILHKQGRYAILHFKELFALDGRKTDFSKEDEQRRNRIVRLLEEWNLLKIISPAKLIDDENIFIKILRNTEKHAWKLSPKYSIGVQKK